LTELGNQVHGELNTDTKPKKTVRKKK